MYKYGKYIFLFFILQLNIFSVLIAQSEKLSFKILRSDLDILSFENEIRDFEIDTLSGYFRILMDDSYSILSEEGTPELPVIQKIIVIPDGAKPQISITKDETLLYPLTDRNITFSLYPVQPSQSKSSVTHRWTRNEKIYNTDTFYKNELITLTEIGVMRGMRLARLVISPFEYNPIKNTIKIHYRISASITFDQADVSQTLAKMERLQSPFYTSFQKNIVNSKAYQNIFIPSTDVPVKYVVVARDSFREALQPFITWKKQRGFTVIELYPDNNANRDSIRAQLSAIYYSASPLDPAPTYLLIVGDVDQIQSFIGKYKLPEGSSHATDLYYAEYTGDIYPELLYGRFSVSNVEQLKTVIEKTIQYESYQLVDDSYLNKAVLVAGKETREPAVTVTNGQVNYLKNNYIVPHFNMDTACYYNPSSNMQQESILAKLSQGAGFVTYSAHCTSGGWSYPNIKKVHIDTFSTTGKYAFVVNNCCKSNDYSVGECFGETLLRKKGAGAIGVIGASNETLWNEDYYWSVGAKYPFSQKPNYQSTSLGAFDRFFHTHGEDISDYAITQGQLLQAGNLAVAQSGSPYENYYWETYNLLGDPSLMPFVGIPDTLSLYLPDSLERGSIFVTCSGTPLTWIALHQDSVLLGTTMLNTQGVGNICLQHPITSPYLMVTATAQYHKPIFDTIYTYSSDTAKVVLVDFQLTDTLGNNLTVLTPNQMVILSGTLVNVGNTTAINSVFKMHSTEGKNVILSQPLVLDTLLPERIYVGELGRFHVLNNVKNNDVVTVWANVEKDGKKMFTRPIQNSVVASELQILPIMFFHNNLETNYLQNDSVYHVQIPIMNKGNAMSDSIQVKLKPNFYSAILHSDSLYYVAPLAMGDTGFAHFMIQIASQTDSALRFGITVKERDVITENEVYFTLEKAIENFETGNFSVFDWDTTAVYPWYIETDVSKCYKGKYSARSASIRGRQYSILKLSLDVVADDTIGFWVKTSSEANYDVLSFYIDNEKKHTWSGISGWQYFYFHVNRGKHTFVWKYEKDDETDKGDDCAWIDDIRLPMSQFDRNIVRNDTLDIPDKMPMFFYRIYPNPAKEYVIFEFGIEQNVSISIYTIKGELIDYITSNNQSLIHYRTDKLQSGIYKVVLKNGIGIAIEKLLIVK